MEFNAVVELNKTQVTEPELTPKESKDDKIAELLGRLSETALELKRLMGKTDETN